MSEIRFAPANNITLHYCLDGLTQGVPLVFINSLGTDLRIWDQVVTRLAAQFRIIRHDKRGHGLSDSPPAPYGIHDQTNDLAGLLAHLQVEKAILVGISVGGVIALDYALSHPKQVEALILSDTAAKIGTDEMWNQRVDTLREHGMAHLAEAILGRWFAPSFAQQHPVEYQGYYNMLVRMPVEGYTGTCEALRDCDLRDSVAAIKAKSLVLCGAEDLATPPDLVRGLAESLPDARFEVIEQAAHLPCIEQPEAMAKIMVRFLQEGGYAG